ncbi:MAG: hypothetical protein E7C91_04435 [Veillonella sp.]|nr:hypothetical protein [Veillonella sp.]
MRKLICNSILAAIAAGLLSVGMATAETVDTPDTTDQAGSTKTLSLELIVYSGTFMIGL